MCGQPFPCNVDDSHGESSHGHCEGNPEAKASGNSQTIELKIEREEEEEKLGENKPEKVEKKENVVKWVHSLPTVFHS